MKADPKATARKTVKHHGARAVARPLAEQPVPATALVQPVQPDAMLTGASTGGSRARQWNRWRERYNPLRGLNIARCVTLLEQYQRGEMADPQWAYFFIEQSDPDLFAIIERREASLLQLDWNIKLVSGRWPKDDPRQGSFDLSLAEEQSAALREAYEGVDNLYEAFGHLQLATFRGFAHCEKYRNAAGDIFHLELVDQWSMVRDLLRGQWKYNPEALSTTFYGISDDNLVDPANFLIRERDRHVGRLALLKFIRSNLSEKDWDAFIEIYGIPSGVVIGPLGVQPDKEAEFKTSAQGIAEGGSGYLPYGSDYKPNDLPRGNDPFRPRLDYLTEKLVLAGTGGLLTMLTASGSGTLAGSAHQEAFNMIARAEARKISEIFQRQFDAEVLRRNFDGRPALAYFELAANEEQDSADIGDLAQKLGSAGYQIAPEELSEKLGFTITLKADPAIKTEDSADDDDGDPLDVPEAEGADLSPIANRLAELRVLPDEQFGRSLADFIANELPALSATIITNRAGAERLTEAISNLLLNTGQSGHPFYGNQWDHVYLAPDTGGGTGRGDQNPREWTPAQQETYRRAKAAIAHALAAKSDLPNAFEREGKVIDLKWGQEGTAAKKFKDGSGLAKIVRKHGAHAAHRIAAVMARGTAQPPNGNTQVITHHGWRVVITKTEGRDQNHWVLTSYHPGIEKKKGNR